MGQVKIFDFHFPAGRTEKYTITETPKHNWGIRGLPGDELTLNYKANI